MGDLQSINDSLEEHQYTTPANTAVNVATSSNDNLSSQC